MSGKSVEQVERFKEVITQSQEPTEVSLEANFKAFAKFGDPKSDGKLITLSNSDKWMKQAGVVDGKSITTTDTGIYFKKLKSQRVEITQYKAFLEDMAKSKKIEIEEIVKKLTHCGAPGHHGIGVSTFAITIYDTFTQTIY